MSSGLIKWIDLKDAEKARLKIGTINTEDGTQRRILFIVGLEKSSPRWNKAIEQLGFMASPKSKYLVRQVREGEKLRPANFHAVWPAATLAELPAEQVHLDLAATRRARETAAPRTEEEATAAQQFGVVTRLGRNAEGDEVFDCAAGRFLQQGDKRVFESKHLTPALFLRAPDAASLDACADGFVQAMLQGEVQHSEDLDRFITAVTGRQAPFDAATFDRMAEVIDAAMVRFLNATYETAQDAYGDANRLYDYLPPYRGAGRGNAAMPLPVSVIAQRLLGDTSGKRVLVPNAFDGASFAFLAQGTQIHAFRGDKDLSRHAQGVRVDDITWADRFDPVQHQGAEGLFFNADPITDHADGSRQDYREALAALRALTPGGRAVLVLAGDNTRSPGELSHESRRFFDALGRRFDVEAALEVGAELTTKLGTETPLRIIALRNRPATATSKRVERLQVLHSWDELKSSVDEAIATIDLREAESEAIDVEQIARENEFQRPYIAFSKVGEARTMVPKNLQAPLQYTLSKLEQQYGPIDAFVEEELGFGPNTLGERFSPEQVDAIGLGIGRMKAGRGFIVGDETGIGKGRSQPLDARVLTPGGWVRMGDLQVGSQVISLDGTGTVVTGIYPQGRIPVFELHFSDGAVARASRDHLWVTMTRNQRHRSKSSPHLPSGSYATHTTAELKDTLGQIHSIPLVRAVEFAPRAVPLDPYLLGVILGDGCIRAHGVQLVLSEEEMLAGVETSLPTSVELRHRARVHYDICKQVGHRWGGLPRKGNNEVVAALRKLALVGKRAHEKFVPEQYIFNTAEVRLGVLQGLMDTDGYCSKAGAVVFSTASERLARDVQEIVRSLGGTASLTRKRTTHRDSHSVFVRLPGGFPPFRLERKTARTKQWSKYPPARYLKEIREVGLAECQCIAVEHPSRLYVTEDYVVTHNTLGALATWAEKQGRDVIFVTDRANLFSDLVRDMRDIGEWARFRPFIMNSDGVLLDVFTNQVLQSGTPPKVMNEVLEGSRTLRELQCNIVFATYSQISGEESPKADWLLQQAEQALVIVDEAHVAAGSDSNTSRVVTDLVNRAWAVTYSSATWAKSSENLHVFGRAFSETINVASLSNTMKTGGEPFSEVFSSMLARDGAFIRREHDLSKIEFVVEIDTERSQRNSELSDRVAEILSAMTFVAGDINKMLIRLNNDVLADLKRAREARKALNVGELRQMGRRAAAAQAARLALERPDGDAQPAPAGEGAAEPAAAQPTAPAQPDLQGEAAEAARSSASTAGFILRSHFGAGSVLYQVMRRFLAVLNADHVVDLALRAVEQNRKPVIVFEDTGESFVKRLIEQEMIPGIDGERSILPEAIHPPTIKDLLRHVMKRMGVITKSAATEDMAATAAERRAAAVERAQEEIDLEEVVQATDSDSAAGHTMSVLDLPGLTPDQQDEYRKGMERIMKMIDELPPLPLNAVDVVKMRLADAGLRVGEISGRKLCLEAPQELARSPIDSNVWEPRNDDSAEQRDAKRWRLTQRVTKKTAVNSTVWAFNSGQLDAVVINRSAATGLSLHASPRFDDTRRRELVEMQIPENPTERIQLYGRVNRYDQVVTPRVSIATSGIYGETRQLMMQNKKLARLSANIRSSRDNAAEIKFVPDLLNPVGEEVCRRFLEENGGIRNRLGITDGELENRYFSAAQRLTSRVALLKVAEQKMVYEELYEMFADALNRYELAGENPLKPREMDLRAQTKESMIAIGVEMDGYGSAFDGPVYLKRIEWEEELRPIEWAQLQQLVAGGRQTLVEQGFAKDLDAESDMVQAPAVLDDGVAPPPEPQVLDQPDIMSVPGPAVTASAVLPQTISFDPAADQADSGPIHRIRYGQFVRHLVEILNAKTRIELSGSDFPDVAAALGAAKNNGVKRAYARKLWVEEFLPKLVPGCAVGLPSGKQDLGGGNFELLRTWGIVTALHPAPKGKEAMLSRWKVDLVVPGDEKPRTMTLAALMEGADLVSIPGENNAGPQLSARSDTIIEGDIFEGQRRDASRQLSEAGVRLDLHRAAQRRSRREIVREDGTPVPPGSDGAAAAAAPAQARGADAQLEIDDVDWRTLRRAGLDWSAPSVAAEIRYTRHKRDFEPRNLERGHVRRKAMVMDGNMYLASEWAAATKQGHGVIYTDDRGLRHRAILLSKGISRHSLLLQHMPVRLWSNQMVARFFQRLLFPVDGQEEVPKNWGAHGYIVPTEFKTAMKWLHGYSMDSAGTVVAIVPGQGIALLVEKSNLARTTRALRGEQRSQLRRSHPDWNNYTEEQREQASAHLATIKSTTKPKRGERPMILLDCNTQEQFQNAVDLLCHAAGVELYLPRGTPLGEVADQVQRGYFQERRRAARAQLGLADEDRAQPVAEDAADAGREQGAQPLASAPAQEAANSSDAGQSGLDMQAVAAPDDDQDDEEPGRERMVA